MGACAEAAQLLGALTRSLMTALRFAPLCSLIAAGCFGSASASGSFSGSGTTIRDNSPRVVDSYDLVVSVSETAPRRAYRNVHVDVQVTAVPSDSVAEFSANDISGVVRSARPAVADSLAAFLATRHDLDATDLAALRTPLREAAQRQLVARFGRDGAKLPYSLRLELVGLYFADGSSSAAP